MSGLYRAAYFTGAFFGPVIGGTLLEYISYQHCYIILAIMVFLNCAILFFVDLVSPQTLEIKSDKQGSYESLVEKMGLE